jgi:hypothetical protein
LTPSEPVRANPSEDHKSRMMIAIDKASANENE